MTLAERHWSGIRERRNEWQVEAALGTLGMRSKLALIPAVLALSLLLSLMIVYPTSADPGVIELYHYGIGDGKLGKPTAFAESWMRPSWLPDRVRWDWPGVALRGYLPGTFVRLIIVDLPRWAESWPELEDLIGNSTFAFVADRPGENYADAWPATFRALTDDQLWIGKLYVRVEAVPVDE